MHYGRVNYYYDGDVLEASITLSLLDDNGITESIDFAVDTGLTEEVALPQDIINRLNLPLADDADDIELTLADGTIAVARVYVANLLWHDRIRRVAVANLEGIPLIGMGLLMGSNLNVDAVPGGLVTITELPAASQPDMPRG